MKKIVLSLLSLFLLLACSSLEVNIDYDPSYQFLQQKNFAIVHNVHEGEDTLLSDRLTRALEADLKDKGYVKVDENGADMVFVFHTNAESKTDIYTDYRMVGYGGYRYGGTMVETTRTYNYTKGTLIIDALTPHDKKIVWRSIATDILRKQETPQERTEYVNSVVTEAMKSFPSKKVTQK